MNLYLGLGMQALLTIAQFMVIPFTTGWTLPQHEAFAGCVASLQALLATVQHMTGKVSLSNPNPPGAAIQDLREGKLN